ncbi:MULTISPECIES: hypothetical protein [Natrialbaceae]|uniref:hypothetical protein n=1 Tax=Natrialbaceae TaxID=1644061 RepID=UPI00207CE080|nr:hypothetical protein [Natronococcus sp. CG52]
MDIPDTRLFHLHYHVPDIKYAEQVLADNGLPLRARFGSVNGETVVVKPREKPPEGFQFRLQDAQRGEANVTLTRGKRVQFDHFGIVTSAFDVIIERAKKADWTVQGVEGPRTFLIPPWGFRIEVHPEDGRITNSLGSWEESRFENVVLTVPSPSEVEEGLQSVLGLVSGVSIRKEEDRPHVPQATLGGQAFPGGLTIRASTLTADSESETPEETK